MRATQADFYSRFFRGYAVAVFVAILCATALEAAYYAHGTGIGYGTKINTVRIGELFRSLEVSDFFRYSNTWLVALIIQPTLVLALLRRSPRTRALRFVVGLPQLILLLPMFLAP